MKSNRGLSPLAAVCLLLLFASVSSTAQDADGRASAADLVSPYAGQEAREIPTLSEEDIRQLQDGEGWGLAKAAELNGVPGPAHLLEIADQGMIELSKSYTPGYIKKQPALLQRRRFFRSKHRE